MARICRAGLAGLMALATLAATLAAASDSPPPPVSADIRVSDKPVRPVTDPLAFQENAGQIRMARQYEQFIANDAQRALDKQNAYWSGLNFSSPLAYTQSLNLYRRDLIRSIGVPDDLQNPQAVRLVSNRPVRVVEGVALSYWQLEIGRTGLRQEALVGVSADRTQPYSVVLGLYDEGSSPEAVFGLTPRRDYRTAFALALAKRGYFVFVPYQIRNRKNAYQLDKGGMGVGMRLVGLHTGMAMRSLDYLSQRRDLNPRKLVVFGVGLGGTLASYLGACDPRVNTTVNLGGFLDLDNAATQRRNLQGSFYLNLSEGQTLFPGEAIPRLIAPRPLFIGYGFDERFRKTADETVVQTLYDRLNLPTLLKMISLAKGLEDFLKPSLEFLRRVCPPSLQPLRGG